MSFKRFLLVLLLAPVSTAADDGWSQSLDLYFGYAFPFRASAVSFLRSLLQQKDIRMSDLCRADLEVFAEQLCKGNADAVSMFDSFSHKKPGQGSRLFYDLGHFESCERARIADRPAASHLLRVGHPHLAVHEATRSDALALANSSWAAKQGRKSLLAEYLPLLFAICLPSSCTRADIESALDSRFVRGHFSPVAFSLERPYDNQSAYYRWAKFVSKAAIGAVLLANVLATWLDCSSPGALGCFNVKRNLESLMKPPSNASTQFIGKIKLFYMLLGCVMHHLFPVTHHVLYSMADPYYSSIVASDVTRYSVFLLPSVISSKFVTSSSLAMFIWHSLLKTRSVSLAQFVLVRALRTLPVVLFVSLVLISWPDWQLRGPLMQLFTANMSGNCFENLWSEVLFVANYVDVDSMCFRTGWLVSADMQLYACSFFLMLFICRSSGCSGRIFAPLIAAATALNVLVCMSYIAEGKRFLSAGEHFVREPMKYIEAFFNTLQYPLPYVVGLWLGYEMARASQWPGERASLLLWASVALHFVSLVVPYSLNLPLLPNWLLVAVVVTHRLFFVLSTAGIFYGLWSRQDLSDGRITACGHICTVASRIELPWYLIHPMVISFLAIWLEFQFTSHLQIVAVLMPAVVIASTALTLVVHLTVEAPFAALMSRHLKRQLAESGHEGRAEDEKTK